MSALQNRDQLLFLIYDLEPGGPELRLLDFARHFPDNAVMHICVLSNNLRLLPKFQETKAVIQVLPVKKAYLEPMKAFRLATIVRKNGIALINVFDLKGLMVAVIAKILFGCRAKIVFNAVDLMHNYSKRNKLVMQMLSRFAAGFVYNSKQVKNIFSPYIPNNSKSQVIYNGLDRNVFSCFRYKKLALRRQYKIDTGSFVIGTVANFRVEKNYPFLINAFKDFVQTDQSAKLLCVGGGPLLQEIQELVILAGLEKHVIFTGYVDDVASFIAMMDVFVLCSRAEGLPNTLLQAMSMEVPVVCSAVGGCLEVVSHNQNGLLFDCDDKAGFSEAIHALAIDQRLRTRLSGNAKKTIEEHFTMGHMIQSYLEFYRSV
ncbi:MAG: glycosyltransferase [Proteobacteria bacterium]|nr:glycosyltransferase [Pseudomonadota bacterium]MBU0967493.1 glycosyltransferase [Pseudomonadota bacterium]